MTASGRRRTVLTPPRRAHGPEPAFVGRVLLVCLALITVTVIVYAPVRQHGFVNFDDPQYVTDNPRVSAGLTGQGFSWAFTTPHAGNWHPVTWLSHMLDAELWGLDAGAHHVTSLSLHIANTVLLFMLLRTMTGALLRSAFVAAVFAVHPLHVESVAWVAERKDVLSALFFLLTVLAYVAYVRRPGWGRYAVVFAAFALGLMAKPMLVTLPFVLLLLDLWPLGRASPQAYRGLILEKLPFVGLAVAVSVVTLAVQAQAGAVAGFEALPLDRRLANAAVTSVAYIGKTLWPSRLAAVYPYPASLSEWSVAGAGALLVVLSGSVIRAARRRPYLPVGWFWYLGMLVPVIGLVQVGGQPMADRYTYLPLVGLFIVVAWGVPDLLARRRSTDLALATMAATVIVACVVVARGQVWHWRSSVALWQHAIHVTDGNYRARNNLGHALLRQGKSGEAIAHFREAVRLKPDHAEAHNNLGLALAGQGRVDEAISHYSEAVRLLPEYVEALNNLGVTLSGEDRDEEAIRYFSEAVRIDPERAASHSNLGAVLARQGRLDEAIRHFAAALRLEPGHAGARKNLAVAHNTVGLARVDQGKIEEAIRHYAEALRLEPDLADVHSNLATALAGQGRVDEAVHEFREALRRDPEDPDLHYDLAVMLTRSGRTAEALRHVETALKLDPAHPAARRARDALSRQRE